MNIALTKHISCKCKYKIDGKKCNSNQKRNNNKCQCECKNWKKHPVYEKIIFGTLVLVLVKMVNVWDLLLVI